MVKSNKGFLLAAALGVVTSLAFSRPSVAEDPDDFLVPYGAGPGEIRPIALAVARTRESEAGKVVISIPREYVGNRDVLVLNQQIKTALIIANVPPDWVGSFYYLPEQWGGSNPHGVWISVVDFKTNLHASTVPAVPSLVGVDMKKFVDEAMVAAGKDPEGRDRSADDYVTGEKVRPQIGLSPKW